MTAESVGYWQCSPCGAQFRNSQGVRGQDRSRPISLLNRNSRRAPEVAVQRAALVWTVLNFKRAIMCTQIFVVWTQRLMRHCQHHDEAHRTHTPYPPMNLKKCHLLFLLFAKLGID
jgi:hypothetical protein